MKRKFTFLIAAALMLLTMMATTGRMWGQSTAIFTPNDFSGQGTSGTGSAISATVSDVTFACDKGYGTTQIRCYKGSQITISSDNTITEIAFTFSDSYNGGLSTSYENLSTNSWEQTLSSQARITQCVVTYSTGGGSTPSITANNVSVDYDATGGSIAYTIDNEVTGGSLSAEVTSGDWLTLGANFASPIAFTCEANPLATERTATVTLTYTYTAKETVTKSVTVTQDGNPNVVNNIEDITGAGDYHVKGMVVATSARGFIIGDGTGYVYTYMSTTAFNYSVGDNLSILGTTSTNYGNVIQFTSSAQVEPVSETNYNGDPQPEVITEVPDYSEGNHLSTYFQYEGFLTKTTSGNSTYYNIAVGEGTIRISYPTTDQIDALEELLNKTVRVHGFFAGNSGTTFTTMMESIEEVQSTEPTITVVDATVDVPVEGEEDELSVTYENFTEILSEVWFCNAAGTEEATYDWITAEINEQTNNVDYLVEPNDGEARSAYFKVRALDDNNEYVYSNLVTVTQAEYVAPTYAGLPFTFNGVRADIEGTDGLYQEGLGSDYSLSTSPNTKLKFDTTNDWLLLQFEERPGTLTFSIKNNSFSEGTFKVQTSVDGTTFEDLKIYTDEVLIGTLNEEFTELNENIRYIKWIYTDRQSGNVGLGNIALAKYVAPVASITVTPDAANVVFAGGAPEFAVTYESLEITGASDFAVEFYDGDVVTSQPSWITDFAITGNTTDGFTLTVTVDANDGDAREAYLKVSAVGNSDFIYSNLVTISQAAYSQLATYTLVESIDDLTPGYHYYIAGKDGENWFAMGGQNNNNRSAVSVNVSNNQISETDNVRGFVISANNDGLYTIYDELVSEKTPGYLYAPAGSSNYLRTQVTNTDNGVWTISIDDETSVVTIKANISADKYMRYNSGSIIFSCYSSNTSQKNIYLFKKDNDTNIAYYGVETTYTEPNIPAGETITVGNGSVMTVPDGFTNTDPTSLIIEDGGQLVVSNPVAATMDKTYAKPSSWGNNSKGVNGWYLISSPVGTVNTSAVANLTPANSYDLYAYNEPDMMWYNAQGADHPFSQLVEGEGYLYSSKDGADAAYSGTVFCGSLTKTLSYEAVNAEMKGWNLLGNPYSHNITWANLTPTGVNESGYYTLGFDGSWSAEPSTTAVIKPMQGFLVQATSAGAKVVFNNIAASAKARSNNDFIAFTVANGQYEDVTYAMFEKGLGLNKINHRNSDIPMVYIPQNGQNYAIATMSDETQSFNLNFKAMTTGKYTLCYKAEGKYDYLHVIDRITGEDVDMLLDGEYSFMASAGDNDARFIVKLRYDANGNFDSDIFAYQNGNDVIVNGEGELQMFDLTGRMVANTMVNGVQTVNVPTQGVYIFRLVGNDVKTQKIVVR